MEGVAELKFWPGGKVVVVEFTGGPLSGSSQLVFVPPVFLYDAAGWPVPGRTFMGDYVYRADGRWHHDGRDPRSGEGWQR